MSFLVAIEGTVVSSVINTGGPGGGPANVPHWPKHGATFKGSFVYTPGAIPTPAMFTKLYVDFGSFTITRKDGIGFITLFNGDYGIRYADGDSPGFNNISLPTAQWQLEDFEMWFTNPQNRGQAVNPAKLDFNFFTERAIFLAGNTGAPISNTLVFSVLNRIDVAIALPA